VRGEETAAQAQRTGKELAEQLNGTGMPGQVVAVRKLPSGDSLLTMDEERTRDSWLRDTKWLAVYGQNARVKRREFIVLAHGIKSRTRLRPSGRSITRILSCKTLWRSCVSPGQRS
jgi:hypothetical protein